MCGWKALTSRTCTSNFKGKLFSTDDMLTKSLKYDGIFEFVLFRADCIVCQNSILQHLGSDGSD
jgi:hypothetical protein